MDIRIIKFECTVCNKPSSSTIFGTLQETSMHKIYLCVCPMCGVEHQVLVPKYRGESTEDKVPTPAQATTPPKNPP
jgi:transcription elongation factor Elf1